MNKGVIIGVPLLVVVIAAGFGLYRLVSRSLPRNFREAGGTVLVYEIDTTKSVDEKLDPVLICEVIRQRLDPTGLRGFLVQPTPPKSIEIRIPKAQRIPTYSIEQIKQILARTGKLEFCILANEQDDKDAIEVAREWFEGLAMLPEAEKVAAQSELDRRAKIGLPPPPPEFKGNRSFIWSTGHANGNATYSWVELSKDYRRENGLDDEAELVKRSLYWDLSKARKRGVPLVFGIGRLLLYGRDCVNQSLTEEDRKKKQFDYFFLVRNQEPENQVSSKHLAKVRSGFNAQMRLAVHMTFDKQGGDLFYEFTSANQPSAKDFRRHLAIILDDRIVSAPTVNTPIRWECEISGASWTEAEVYALVRVLQAGTMPAVLKLVEEREVPPGSD